MIHTESTRVFSGLKPTGPLQFGNYLGAIRPMVALQDAPGAPYECLYSVVDLHALTVEHEPARVRELSRQHTALAIACGIDPARTVLFVQSHVRAHAELAYLLECTVGVGELQRMIQFKEKSVRGGESVRTSLLTYPALMAADILLYDAAQVPVGEDQGQHLELTRTLARRFNATYGETFVVPTVMHPPFVGRVMNLNDPQQKMGKTGSTPQGVLYLLDSSEAIASKIARAVTDAASDVRYDSVTRPGVSNLLAIFGALTGEDPAAAGDRFGSYRVLKQAVTDEVVGTLAPVQARYRELVRDPAELNRVLRGGAERAAAIADLTLRRAQRAIGLLEPERVDAVLAGRG